MFLSRVVRHVVSRSQPMTASHVRPLATNVITERCDVITSEYVVRGERPKTASKIAADYWMSQRRENHQEPDRKTTALTIISDLRHLRRSPAPALTLGLAGLIPFASAPAYLLLTDTHFAETCAFAQMAYGAAILSFLGGVRWGVTLPHGSPVSPDWRNMIYSITPSLIAWVGLLLPYPASTLTVMAGLCGCAYFDLTMAGYPAWFKALRFVLTFVAVLSLWTMIVVKELRLRKSDRSENLNETDKKENSQNSV